LDQTGQTCVPGRRPILACMACQQSCRPQLMRIAVILGFLACQRDQPTLASGVIVGSLPGRGRSSRAASAP
jgi:hypothetical protein